MDHLKQSGFSQDWYSKKKNLKNKEHIANLQKNI